MLAEAENSKTCKIVNMSLNLNKHGSVLREVWKELLACADISDSSLNDTDKDWLLERNRFRTPQRERKGALLLTDPAFAGEAGAC